MPTVNHLTAQAGANLRGQMDRMGHSTTRAALIYLHATREQQQAVADAVDNLARGGLDRPAKQSRRRRAGTAGWGRAINDDEKLANKGLTCKFL